MKESPGSIVYSLNGTIRIVLIDFIAIVVLLSVPVISHKLDIPLYLLEPIRLSLIISIIYSNKLNSVFMGIIMPLLSFILVSHPLLLKAILISFELIIFIFLLYYFIKKLKYNFLAVFISILISKIMYYVIKYILINEFYLQGELISTPVEIQIITTLFYSYLFSILYNKKG